MKLYIGGYKQGKLNYVLTNNHCADSEVFSDFHLWIRELIRQGKDAEEMAEEYIIRHPDAIIISDEVGNGIVPMDPFEREYRERLGRILIRVAEKAEHVERIICGIGQRIK